jgi:hypothetical protein
MSTRTQQPRHRGHSSWMAVSCPVRNSTLFPLAVAVLKPNLCSSNPDSKPSVKVLCLLSPISHLLITPSINVALTLDSPPRRHGILTQTKSPYQTNLSLSVYIPQFGEQVQVPFIYSHESSANRLRSDSNNHQDAFLFRLQPRHHSNSDTSLQHLQINPVMYDVGIQCTCVILRLRINH